MNSREMTASRPWSGLEGLRLGRSRRRALLSLLVAVPLAAGVWLAIGQVASYPRLLRALDRSDAWWLVLALAGTGLTYVGYAFMYRIFSSADQGPRPTPRIAIRLAVAIFGASVIATAAGRLGAEYVSLRRMRERPPVAWARVLALNTASWAVLAALGCLSALGLLLFGTGSVPLGVELGWLLVPLACCVPAAYLSAPGRRTLAEDRGGRVRRLAASVVRSLVLLRSTAARPSGLARIGGTGLLYWGGELLIAWAALRAFGVTLGPAALVIGYGTGYASTILPLPAGGAGGVDAATIYGLALVGVPLGPAILAALVQRVFSYWLPIAIAAVSVRSIRRLNEDLVQVARGSSGSPGPGVTTR